MKLTSPFVITINRQLGSGGAYIGQQLAKKLDIFYADREIIDQAAKQLSMLAEDLESQDEKVSSFWKSYLKSFAFGTPDVYLPPKVIIPTDRELFKTETGIIKHIVNERSVVIIGRCGCHILRDHPNRVSLYLHADMAFRRDRIQKTNNVSVEAAEKMILQSDKERPLYYHTFTGKEWSDARQYDISINTGKIGLDQSVEFIMKYLGDINSICS
jgi:CMP/dCMP kinase